MTDNHQHALTTLREIDASFHRLFEAVAEDNVGSTPAANPLATLHRAQARIDAALFAHHQRADDTGLPESGACLLQWDPPSTPPRRLVFEPDGGNWCRREHEWTGDGWRTCGRDTVENVAIRVPAAPHYPNPVDPPTIDTLLAWIRGTWTNPDPPALVFDRTPTTEQGVLVAVGDELRYRERDSHQWYAVTEHALTEHLQQQGQPTLQSLAETALSRHHFTHRSLTQ